MERIWEWVSWERRSAFGGGDLGASNKEMMGDIVLTEIKLEFLIHNRIMAGEEEDRCGSSPWSKSRGSQ